MARTCRAPSSATTSKATAGRKEPRA